MPSKPRLIAEAPSGQQVGRIVVGKAGDINSEARLHRHPAHRSEIRVAHEEVVGIVDQIGDLAHGCAQQTQPESPLDYDRLVIAVFVVETP